MTEQPIGLGPNGEIVTQAIKTDPATGYPLPSKINGIPLPDNFNSGRTRTWPKGLERKHVDAWIFSQRAPAAPYVPETDEQPSAPEVPVNKEGFTEGPKIDAIDAKLEAILKAQNEILEAIKSPSQVLPGVKGL